MKKYKAIYKIFDIEWLGQINQQSNQNSKKERKKNRETKE